MQGRTLANLGKLKISKKNGLWGLTAKQSFGPQRLIVTQLKGLNHVNRNANPKGFLLGLLSSMIP